MEPENVLEKALCERPSIPLYHYTTAQGLIGIFNEGLWASSAYHLNDSNEFGYAINLVRDTLQNNLRHERGPNNEAYGKILEDLETIKTSCHSERVPGGESVSLHYYKSIFYNGLGLLNSSREGRGIHVWRQV